MQLYNNIDSIPTWSLNPNGVYQEQALSRNTIYQSPSWVVNILRKDRETSVYLYTILKPGGVIPLYIVVVEDASWEMAVIGQVQDCIIIVLVFYHGIVGMILMTRLSE